MDKVQSFTGGYGRGCDRQVFVIGRLPIWAWVPRPASCTDEGGVTSFVMQTLPRCPDISWTVLIPEHKTWKERGCRRVFSADRQTQKECSRWI